MRRPPRPGLADAPSSHSHRGALLLTHGPALAARAVYSLVARGTCVLAEFTTTSGNFTTVTRRILEKLPTEDSKMSYVYDSHVFHYVVSGGLVYLCMADGDFGRRVPFLFLDDIVQRWVGAYGQRGQTALAYGMNEDFSRVMQRQMDFFSRDPTADRVSRVREEIDEVRSVMVDNIEKVLQRGEKIELLVDKTENLNQQVRPRSSSPAAPACLLHQSPEHSLHPSRPGPTSRAGLPLQEAVDGAKARDVVQERQAHAVCHLCGGARHPLCRNGLLRRRLWQVPLALRPCQPAAAQHAGGGRASADGGGKRVGGRWSWSLVERTSTVPTHVHGVRLEVGRS